MPGHKRALLNIEAKIFLKTHEMPWQLNEETDRVCVKFNTWDLPEFLNYLKRECGFKQAEAREFGKSRKRESADYIVHLKNLEDGWTRDGEASFIEIVNPDMNAFLKREILGIEPQISR